jgi:O-methyltransferase
MTTINRELLEVAAQLNTAWARKSRFNVAALLTPGQRADWPHRYPRAWKLAAHGYQLLKWTRRIGYRRIFNKFHPYSMLSWPAYAENLALVDMVNHVPGAVVECGTWRGGMVAGIAKLLGPSRRYFIYDSFEGLPPAGREDRDEWQTAAEWQAKTTHNDCAPEESVREAMRLSGATNVTITKGWFSNTLPTYPGDPIAIVRLDGDWYSSTMDILNNLYPYVVSGGMLILDDYYYWEGCSRAVHEFLSKQPRSVAIRQSRNGGYAYIIKH